MAGRGFVILESWAKMFSQLPDENAAALIKLMSNYLLDKDDNCEDPVALAVFESWRGQLDEQASKYEAKVQRIKDNSSRSCENKDEIETISNRNRDDIEPKSECISKSKSISISPNGDKDSITHTRTRNFVPPTVEEVRAYCQEKGIKVDADRFVDFYASKGWVVGKSKMKDWKAAARNWGRDQGKSPPKKQNAFNQYEQNEYDFDELERQLIRN